MLRSQKRLVLVSNHFVLCVNGARPIEHSAANTKHHPTGTQSSPVHVGFYPSEGFMVWPVKPKACVLPACLTVLLVSIGEQTCRLCYTLS